VEREWGLLEGETHLAIRSDRRDHLPYGLFSGKQGKGSINVVHKGDGVEEVLATMISTTLKAGEILYHRQAGGGGWGDPLERVPEAVARDVKNEKVSFESARDAYGVVLDEATGEVDQAATEARRKKMGKAAKRDESEQE
jgi:N-methylhydantoinase B